jgi:DUF177 domain-containing protein
MPDEWILDPATLSAKPRTFSGELAPGDLPRLRELLASPKGSLLFTVSARLDPQRRKLVSCIIKGFAQLTCQSTMEVFRHDLDVSDRLVLVDDESALPPIEAESEEEDFVVADGPLDVRTRVEDAVILALPMIPRKPGAALPESGPAAGEPRKESPFAALKRPK